MNFRQKAPRAQRRARAKPGTGQNRGRAKPGAKPGKTGDGQNRGKTGDRRDVTLFQPLRKTQTTSGQTYPFSYSYNLIDEVKQMTMPSGRAVTTTYDTFGRPVGLSGLLGSNTTNYVSTVSYAPQGAPQVIAFGNTLMEEACYNNQLQPFVIRQRRNTLPSCQTSPAPDGNDVGYLAYTFSSTQNNGNVSGQAIHYGASDAYPAMDFQQNYTYTDPSTGNAVSRLISANESGGNNTPWTQQFNYDLVGNRWLNLGGMQIDPLTPTADFYDANNRLTTAGYNDGRGNVTQLGGYVYQYDAENRLIASTLSLNGVTLASATYAYDGDGRRVVKQSGGVTTQYVYDVQGNLVVEQTVTGTATPMPCSPCYLMPDHLGSTRMLTDASGNQMVLYDYAPFGEELTTQSGRDARWGAAGSGLHFTGKEQEGYEGGYLHYFGARYYSGGLGRFTSPDEPLAGEDPSSPQSWNLYSYGLNNPLLYSDPSGHNPCVDGVNPETGNICATGTAQPPGLNQLEEMILRSLLNTVTTAAQVVQKTQDVLQPALDWIATPHDASCMGKAMLGGAMAGAGGGALLGLAGGGVADLGTVPLGFLGGAGLSGVAALNTCMSSTGGGSGGDRGGSGSGGAQDKKLSPSEIKKLENSTGESAHRIKTEALGTRYDIAQYDLYKDAAGNVFVKAKGGVGEAIPTGLRIR